MVAYCLTKFGSFFQLDAYALEQNKPGYRKGPVRHRPLDTDGSNDAPYHTRRISAKSGRRLTGQSTREKFVKGCYSLTRKIFEARGVYGQRDIDRLTRQQIEDAMNTEAGNSEPSQEQLAAQERIRRYKTSGM